MSVLTNFEPKRYILTNITNSKNAVCTTSENHDYVIGQTVNIRCPKDYGMVIDYEDAKITAITEDTFTCDLNTLDRDTFSVPGTTKTEAQVVPVTGIFQNNISLFGDS